MALVAFRSKAAAEVFYFEQDANRLLEIAGKVGPRGIFTADQIPDAIARIEAAIDLERDAAARQAAQRDDSDAGDEPAMRKRVALAQRAFPLLDMLRAALKKKADVTWGV